MGQKALLELPFKIKLDDVVRPVKLPQNCQNIEKFELVYAAGNGRTIFNERISDLRLRQATFVVLSHNQCNYFLGKDVPSVESLICAISKNGQYTGAGDSGK